MIEIDAKQLIQVLKHMSAFRSCDAYLPALWDYLLEVQYNSLYLLATDGKIMYQRRIPYESQNYTPEYRRWVVDLEPLLEKIPKDATKLKIELTPNSMAFFVGKDVIYTCTPIKNTFPEAERIIQRAKESDAYLELDIKEVEGLLEKAYKKQLVWFRFRIRSQDECKSFRVYTHTKDLLNVEVPWKFLEYSVHKDSLLYKEALNIVFNAKYLKQVVKAHKADRQLHKKKYGTEFYEKNKFRIWFHQDGLFNWKEESCISACRIEMTDSALIIMPIFYDQNTIKDILQNIESDKNDSYRKEKVCI
jgi:DNA polymerase III sliding clamp (beta) subunit (PCNA family)